MEWLGLWAGHSAPWVFAIVIIALLVAAGLALRWFWDLIWHRDQKSLSPYQRHKTLFTASERAFLLALERAVADDYRVYGKVRIADVLKVRAMADKRAWWNLFVQISSKHFDYVLCDRKNLSIVAAVELDDRSHDRADRRKRDIFVNEACKCAGLPLVRIKARWRYDEKDIRRRVRAVVKR